MGKFSRLPVLPRASIQTTDATIPTHEGGLGYERDPRSELFLLAVTNMVSEQTFYESGEDRDSRFVQLVRAVAQIDPSWMMTFIPYLRNTMQMRSASIVTAVECCVANDTMRRTRVIASALSRADEPGEMLAYYHIQHGRSLPSWLKRGIALSLPRLYTEQSFLKYSGQSQAWSFGDVIARTHAVPPSSHLWKFFILARYNRGQDAWAWLREQPADTLPMLRAWDELNRIPTEQRTCPDAATLAASGMTWERLSSWLGRMDAEAWSAMIPSMGYMALLRNLRNFEDAGVPEDLLASVATKLTDPEQVRQSRQFPIRFFSAYKNLRSERFGYALEQALNTSVQNIPALSGRTLILIDCSGSMDVPISDRSEVKRSEIAALFGLCLAKRCEQSDVFAYGSTHVPVQTSGPVLRALSQFTDMGGTYTWQTLEATYRAHDRVVILTDEQAQPYDGPTVIVPRLYTFNLAGYKPAHNEQGKDGSYTFGGLTDAGFSLMDLLERGEDARWPFSTAGTTKS